MKIAVIGAGAVGCYFGGLLALAGHDVTFIGRQSHVDAINQDGVLIDGVDFVERVKAKAVTDTASLEPSDLVLFCVKSADTEATGRSLSSVIGPDTVILSLQNGVDNAERLGAVIGRPVLPAVVYVGTGMAGPGHVKHFGGGSLVIGASPASEEIAKVLVEARIPTTVSPDIAVALWTKLIVNCAWNALSAIANLPYGAIIKVDGARELVGNIVSECTALAGRCGASLPSDLLDDVLKLSVMMPGQVSSTARDLMRGKPTEIDFLNGYVVAKGREMGIATPVNQAIHVLVKLAEEGRRNPAL